MTITNRQVVYFTIIGLYTTLVIHDFNLYKNLSLITSLLLSLLRLLLILFPLITGFYIAKSAVSVRIKYLLVAVWLFFLPYTAYSLAEIRHVSELCRLPAGQAYTQACVADAWQLAPVFIYALAGVLAFVFSLSQVSAFLFTRSIYKRLFILGVSFYCAFATSFGLYSRINMWDIFVHPIKFATDLLKIITLPDFVLNTFILAIFFIGILFVVNRIIRKAGKWIPE